MPLRTPTESTEAVYTFEIVLPLRGYNGIKRKPYNMALAPADQRLLALAGKPNLAEGIIKMRERRKSRRFKATLDAEYTKVEGCAVINSLTSTRNISSCGLCTTLSSVVKKGDDLLIELDLPHNKRLATLVKVVWAKPAGRNSRNICGLKILWVSSQPLLRDCVGYAREIQAAA